jgi:hypothetical protein
VKFVWILIAFALGAVVGWAATGQFTADWVGATGTWVGAIATIATIIWAVRSFQLETRDREVNRERDQADELRAEQVRASDFSVGIRGGGGYGQDGDKTMGNINVEILNGTAGAVTVEELELPGVALKNVATTLSLPLIVPPHSKPDTPYRQIEIEPMKVPDEQFSGRPFMMATPVIRYRIAGVRWERTGDDPPIRTDG